MNLDFSPEQKELREQARRFLTDQGGVSRARKVLESDASCDRELWAEMAEMGWLGVAIAEEHGGVGMGYLGLCVLGEELGRVLSPVPFSSTLYLFAEAVRQYGSLEQQQQYLPSIVRGELIATAAIAEGFSAVQSEQDVQCRFAGGVLNGKKIAVPDGDIANVAVVLARTDKDSGLYLVDLSGRGVQREASKSIDGSKSYGSVEFSDAAAVPLGSGKDGWAMWRELAQRAAVLFAFEQLGLADSALEMARNYALERYAFGRPIGSYQAVKHRLADMYIGTQLARSNCYYAAWALSTGAAELPVAAAAARVSVSQAADFNAKENIQLHGGMGFTWEFDCHLYYRRSKVLSLVVGAPDEWKDRLIAALEQSNHAGCAAGSMGAQQGAAR